MCIIMIMDIVYILNKTVPQLEENKLNRETTGLEQQSAVRIIQ